MTVELTAFAAEQDGEDVVLRWQTAREQNNAGFTVEHASVSAGAVGATREAPLRWLPLGDVSGHGTTAEAQAYTFRATGLAPGTHRFRLRQLDSDGAATLSDEVEVEVAIAEAFRLSALYPNPFNSQTQFTLAVREAQEVEVGVYTVLGRRVAVLHEGVLEANWTYTFRLDGSALASGVYFVRVSSAQFVQAQRVTLVR